MERNELHFTSAVLQCFCVRNSKGLWVQGREEPGELGELGELGDLGEPRDLGVGGCTQVVPNPQGGIRVAGVRGAFTP